MNEMAAYTSLEEDEVMHHKKTGFSGQRIKSQGKHPPSLWLLRESPEPYFCTAQYWGRAKMLHAGAIKDMKKYQLRRREHGHK